MELESLEYPLAPALGMPLGVRKQQLETSRFIDIRNLVAHVYKKAGPNGQLVPLMQYNETLDNRELVRKTVLVHELSSTFQGQPLVVNDGTNLDAPPTAVQQPPNGVQNGTTQMQPQPPPQYAPPPAPVGPGAAAAVPVQQFAPPPMAAPGFPPQQQFAPPPQAAPGPQAPPPAGPAEVAAAAPSGGRKRRGSAGAAVAPPPPAPPPPAAAPVMAAPMVPQGYQQAPGGPPAGYGQAPVAAAPAAWTPPAAPGAPSWTPPQAAPVAPTPAPQAPAGVDLSQVTQRLDDLGKGLTHSVNELKELKQLLTLNLVAMHHVYLAFPQLRDPTQGKADNFPAFQQYLAQYLPR